MDKLLDKIFRRTDKRFAFFERILYGAILNYFVDNIRQDQDGNVTADGYNSAKLEGMKTVVKSVVSGSLTELLFSIVDNIMEFFGKGVKDLQKFDVSAIEKSRDTFDKLRQQSSTTANKIIDLELIFTDIKARSITLMSRPGGISLKELRKELETVIVDKKIMTRYYGRWTHDIYSQYQRIATNEVRKKLGLRFAIYQGGLIETSRDFCEERNGKVWTEDEIEAWANLDWEGKQEAGYNVFADLGGYNCRHRLDWISDELAFRKRPELRDKYEKAA